MKTTAGPKYPMNDCRQSTPIVLEHIVAVQLIMKG